MTESQQIYRPGGQKFPTSIYVLATRTGLRPSTISRILNGRGVRLENAAKVARAMGVSLQQFLSTYYPRIAA